MTDKPLPFVSIIIPSFNDNARLELAVEAIEGQNYPGDFEILVVDNGSDEVPQLDTSRSTLLHEAAPGSYNARNKALGVAKGDYFAFTDSDCIPDKDWLRKGIEALLSNPDAGLVGGRVQIFPQNVENAEIAELFDMAIGFPQAHYIANGHYAATANMFTRKTVFDTVGNFRGDLKSGGDADWGKRVHAAGFPLIYEADALVLHPARASHAEIVKKVRRTTGGERDRNPSWGKALRFAAALALPPHQRMANAFRLPDQPLRRRTAVAGYALLINWLHSLERLRLQFTGKESNRS